MGLAGQVVYVQLAGAVPVPLQQGQHFPIGVSPGLLHIEVLYRTQLSIACSMGNTLLLRCMSLHLCSLAECRGCWHNLTQ